MKATITFQSDSAVKINLLLRVAHEMGVTTLLNNLFLEEDTDWKLLAEKNLATDWLKPEEDIWDSFLKARLNEK